MSKGAVSVRAGETHNHSAAAAAVQMKRRVSRASLPEVIKIEPVEGRHTAIRLEPFNIVSHCPVGLLAAAARARIVADRQTFEKDIIALAATIHTEHQHDGALQQGRHAEGPQRERCRCAEEVTAALLLAVEHAISENADKVPVIEARFSLDQRVGLPKRDDIQRQARIDGVQHGSDLARVLLVHDKADAQSGLHPAHRPHHREAAEMRAEENAPRALPQDVQDYFLTVNADVEAIDLIVQQKNAIERGGAEAVVVAKQIGWAGLATERSGEVVAGGASRAQREDEEVSTDRIQQHPCGGPPEP